MSLVALDASLPSTAWGPNLGRCGPPRLVTVSRVLSRCGEVTLAPKDAFSSSGPPRRTREDHALERHEPAVVARVVYAEATSNAGR